MGAANGDERRQRGPAPIAELAAATRRRRWPASVLSGIFAWIE